MRKLTILLSIVLVPFLVRCQSTGGYNIQVNISGLRDSTLYLAYHLGNRQYLKDTLILDNSGKGTFTGTETLPGGIYMVVLPGRNYFEILIDKDQQFGVSCSYNNYQETLKFSGSSVNSGFVEYQKKWGAFQQKGAMLSKRIQSNKANQDSVKLLTENQKSLEKEMKSYLRSVVSSNEGNILAVLVKAIIPIESPEFSVSPGARNRDSLLWVMRYNYNKEHFFDNLDFSDERILRTPILHSRLEAYFSNVLIQHPDSLLGAVDMVIAKSEANYKVFQYVAVYVFNHFRESQIMGHDAVLLRIADEVYLSGKADWVSKEFIEDLKRQTELIRNNLIGMTAADLVMDSYKGVYVALHDIEKDFTIIYFWEPDCGHCKEATPKLIEYYNREKDNGVEVFAVCTTGEKEKWADYIEKNQLSWINGWDPERRTHFDFLYNVQSTPMIYILDRNKKIIAKKLSVEDVPSFIENYRKYNM